MGYKVGGFTILADGEKPPARSLGLTLLPFTDSAPHPWWSADTRALLEELPSLVTPGMRVLDFGCGAWAVLSLAVARLGATPFPVEINSELARHAEACLAANGLECPVPPAPDQERYDYAIANVGDAPLVEAVAALAEHGIGTARDGSTIRW